MRDVTSAKGNWDPGGRITLPFVFDTSPVVRLILRGVLALLLLVIVPGLLYSLLISHQVVVAVQLCIIGLIAGYFGWIFFRNLSATCGSVGRDEVVLQPVVLYGVRLHGPVGRFPLRKFTAVRVERIPPPLFAQGSSHERVTLLGGGGTPDVLLARTSRGAGRALGRELADAIGLPYKEEDAPY
jgi:hypothetical protein